ncbi:hypothetical protein [Fulvivirga sp.]|uniref:hypothetical protein n=1 Tax=Fulvivirga sp. TaxID=1931237 RepID=UPI0032EA9A9F
MYQLDDFSPTAHYLSIGCDSSFHFITRYDFGGKKLYQPEIDKDIKWVVMQDSILNLPDFSSKKKFFKILSDSSIMEVRKKESYLWKKIITYNNNCQAIKFTSLQSDGYTVYYLTPDQQPLLIKEFKNNELIKRTHYYELGDDELNLIKQKHPRVYQITEPVQKISTPTYFLEYQLPIKMIEEWIDGEYKVSNFDKKENKVKE